MAIKYIQIAKEMKNLLIESNRSVSYKLPTEAELCIRYGASRQTIRQALSLLEKEHYIYKKQGSGIYTIPQLSSLSSKKVALLISDSHEYLNPSFISTLKKELQAHHLSLNVYTTNWDYNVERQHLLSLLGNQLYALYIEGNKTSFQNPNLDLYKKLEEAGTKLIFLNSQSLPLSHANYVNADHYQGGYLLAKQLISYNRTQVSFLMPDFSAEAKERYAGFQAAFRDFNMQIPDNNIFSYSASNLMLLRSRQDTSFLTSYINQGIWKYDSAVCYSDEIAYWFIKELSLAKIAVPAQMSIVSFDNSYLSKLGAISLASMTLPQNEPAASAAHILIDYLYEKETSDVTLHWEFTRGASIQPLL